VRALTRKRAIAREREREREREKGGAEDRESIDEWGGDTMLTMLTDGLHFLLYYKMNQFFLNDHYSIEECGGVSMLTEGLDFFLYLGSLLETLLLPITHKIIQSSQEQNNEESLLLPILAHTVDLWY
jgi:hypothetical protein